MLTPRSFSSSVVLISAVPSIRFAGPHRVAKVMRHQRHLLRELPSVITRTEVLVICVLTPHMTALILFAQFVIKLSCLSCVDWCLTNIRYITAGERIGKRYHMLAVANS